MKIPVQIINQLKENFSVDISAFEESHTQTVPVSVRLNPLKPACGFAFDKQVPWTSDAFYLTERPIFTNDPLFHAGCYYVQEASSMFIEQAFAQTVNASKPLIVLDACAAPGGKSTLLASLLGEESLLVSNEVISTRVPVLTHNMAKWGSINSMVTNNDPQDFSRLPNFFDVMVVDAPCSGSGLFRKQDDAIEHWSEENVNHCSLRQQRILTDLLPALKQDGILIYSTCSYSVEENENMCDYLCEKFSLEPIKLKTLPEWGITETQSDKHKAFGYRFFPHLTMGEGFFLACFRKKVTEEHNVNRNQHKLFTKISADEDMAVKKVINAENLDFVKFYDDICGFHKGSTYAVNKITSALKIKKLPLHIGQLKGKDFIPHPYLAYQNKINGDAIKVDVDALMALQYLRKQPFLLSDTTKGFSLLTYKDFNLGWFKNLGNRINNYYPAEWRILKEVF
ncbi:MAG TPA: RNA methyltransferase [Bacteroidia bacterium]|jgi:16S rRNA C967 or C1407 C5-methylase (RsmB/RsmF family)|nr:RNA methyltransferase [Bacteroidia bacterium]